MTTTSTAALIPFIGFISLALAACGDGPAPTATASPQGSTITADPASDARQSVTGHVDFVNPVNGNRWQMSITAIGHADGRVTGKNEQHVEVAATGALVRKAYIAIVCVSVLGNVARYGGVIKRTEGVSAPVGSEVVGTVVDNGEGATDPPDLASPTVPASAATHCATGITPAPRLIPVERGNIQVRP